MKPTKFRLLQNLTDGDEIILQHQEDHEYYMIYDPLGSFKVRGIDTTYSYNIYDLEKNNIVKIY